MKIIHEFREFAIKGNVVDLAIGLIIGAAFNKIVTSLVNDIIMPPIGVLLGRVDFSNLFVAVSGQHFATLAQAKAANVATINYGTFINTIIEFLIVGFTVFMIIRTMNRLRHEPEKPPTHKKCPYCKSDIDIEATKCAFCTADVPATA
jgi:large conductance mechanosensitive channel